MNTNLTQLYREAIMQHAAMPVGFQEKISATHRNEQYNPLCGDRVEILLRLLDGQVEAAAFDGEACTICTASASMLCEMAPGRAVDELSAAQQWLAAALAGDDEAPGNETLRPLLGVRRYPSRIRCALLPWEALVEAIQS